tara:strand:- start:138 stop:1166 length:1029 start_codon:yes stop_codon:yes gene_type:complete
MVTSADPNYTYIWEDVSNPGVVLSSLGTLSNLFAGDYLVTVQYTDSLGQLLSGCNVSSLPYTLNDGDEIIITETLHTDILCNGDNTGAISILPSGGLSPYTYTWNPSQSTNTTIINLLAGNYTLTVEDANNCEQSKLMTIVESLALTANITQNGYVLTASNPTGGVTPYSYSWRKQSQSNVHLQAGITYNVYSAGTYYVLVTDSNGCEVQSNSILYVTPPPSSSWDCIAGQGCSDPGTGMGMYASQAACDIVCGVSAVDETSTGIALSIYPNPFKEETTVDFGRDVKQASVRVVDVFGKLIEEYSVTNTDKHILKRENKASGIYFIEIEVEGLFVKEKLIIE